MDWQLVVRALALVMVIEGLLPFMAPSRLRETMARMSKLDDRILRTFGFLTMLTGMVLLQLV